MRHLAVAVALAFAGCADSESVLDPEVGMGEGVDFDEDNQGANLFDDKSDAPRYAIPTGLPQLVAPEIIVSLDGLTVHLFDRQTGFNVVYPAGVGQIVNGKSLTPVGHFETSADITDTWYYVARRNVPEYFGGFPFLRINARNRNGAHTYGLHGPITTPLERGYVSQGCIRMASDDIIRLFWMVKKNPSTPVTFQKEVELDAAGRRVDVGRTPALYPAGVQIRFGASVGPRPF